MASGEAAAIPKKIYCNRCKQTTNHQLQGFYTRTLEEEDFYEREDCSFYSCAGCEAPTMAVEYSSIALDEPTYSVYPKRNYSERPYKRFSRLPAPLVQTYRETVDALNSGCSLLCTIGLRTLLEGVCADKKVAGRVLADKINALGKKYLPGNMTDYLHGFRFSGNDAAHQLEAMSRMELKIAFDVMEDLLNIIYDLDYKASRLKNAKKQSALVEADAFVVSEN